MERPNISRFEAVGTPAANGQYQYAAGISGVRAVPVGAYLLGVTAYATSAGATVQIGDGDVVPMPASGSVAFTVNGGRVGPFNVTFTGTAGYLIEYVI